jgi:HSP20 family protein
MAEGGKKMNYEMWMLARRMNQLMDEWMHAKFRGDPGEAWEPAADIIECEHFLCVLVELAGMKRSEIDIAFSGATVTVSGTRAVKNATGPVQVHQMELARGAFRRVLQLPFDVPVDQVEIVYEHGLLEMKMPRPTASR